MTGHNGVKVEFTFIFRSHRRPIQLPVFVPVGLSSFLHLLQVLLSVEISSVARSGQLTDGVQITDFDTQQLKESVI